MLKGFKDFISRGNVVELAIAFVIGIQFSNLINAIVSGLITPIFSAVFGKASLTQVGNFSINHSDFSIGLVLDAVFRFLVIAAAIYFLIIVPLNMLAARRKRSESLIDEPAGPTEIQLLTEIRDSLKK